MMATIFTLVPFLIYLFILVFAVTSVIKALDLMRERNGYLKSISDELSAKNRENKSVQ